MSEETQELLARVAELQQEKWNLEEKVWRAKERWRGREGVRKRERERGGEGEGRVRVLASPDVCLFKNTE